MPKTADGLEDEDVCDDETLEGVKEEEEEEKEETVKEPEKTTKVKRSRSTVKKQWLKAYERVQLAITEGKVDEVAGEEGQEVARRRRSRLANLKWRLVLKRLEEENSNRKKEKEEEEVMEEEEENKAEEEKKQTDEGKQKTDGNRSKSKEKSKKKEKKSSRSKSREVEEDGGSRTNTLRAKGKRLRDRSVSATRALVEKSKDLLTNTLTRRGRSKDRRSKRVEDEDEVLIVEQKQPQKRCDVKQAVARKLEYDDKKPVEEEKEDANKNDLRIEEEPRSLKSRFSDARQSTRRGRERVTGRLEKCRRVIVFCEILIAEVRDLRA